LWRVGELAGEPPYGGPGGSFSARTGGGASAGGGGVQRWWAPPAPRPGPNGREAAVAAALDLKASADPRARLIPRQVDVGERFADDPANFTVKEAVQPQAWASLVRGFVYGMDFDCR